MKSYGNFPILNSLVQGAGLIGVQCNRQANVKIAFWLTPVCSVHNRSRKTMIGSPRCVCVAIESTNGANCCWLKCREISPCWPRQTAVPAVTTGWTRLIKYSSKTAVFPRKRNTSTSRKLAERDAALTDQANERVNESNAAVSG